MEGFPRIFSTTLAGKGSIGVTPGNCHVNYRLHFATGRSAGDRGDFDAIAVAGGMRAEKLAQGVLADGPNPDRRFPTFVRQGACG